MAELLIELFSEEIPARMQAGACEDLRRLVTNALVDRGLLYEGAKAFATPRRLTLIVGGLPPRQPDRREERKGPRLSAPDAAKQGFLRSLGLQPDAAMLAELATRGRLAFADGVVVEARGEGNAASLFALTERKGRGTVEVAAEILPEIIRSFPWPKSMRWGTGRLRWVRPLHSILCTFAAGQEEPDIVHFDIDGIVSSDCTHGHRFLAPEPIRVRRFEDYLERLRIAYVVLDAERRREMILADARTLAHAQNLELVEDPAVADEVSGLVEWPVVLMGSFDPAFLDVPPEVIRTTIRVNQKCFVLRDPATGALADKFILTANLEARDGGHAIVAGNERVVRARLSDARFFWELDKKTPLEAFVEKLKAVTFFELLGSQFDRVRVIEETAVYLVERLGFDRSVALQARRAAQLCKADLTTDMVGEFANLQGYMGRQYAQLQGEAPEVAAAIEEHYKPQGPSDATPTAIVSIAVALAEKFASLVGFWSIDEKPTGSKDPFALRRAALGIIRIIIENGLRVSLLEIFDKVHRFWSESERGATGSIKRFGDDLLVFFADRLKVQLREQGARHDLVDAVFALGASSLPVGERSPRSVSDKAGEGAQTSPLEPAIPALHADLSPTGRGGAANDDLVLIVRRVEALGAFLNTEDGKNLLAGYRRAANILRAEEKKDGEGVFEGEPEGTLFELHEERVLAGALANAEQETAVCLSREDFAGAMRAIAGLRPAVDAFFDKVTVNADDPELRRNRLRLLAGLRRTTRAVADFDRISG